jgi:hypothetical protein
MKKLMIAAVAVAAMAFAGTAGASLVPGVFDPDHTGCPVAKAQGGYLHLEKNCATTTNASAGADITGLTSQTFTSASFTLKSATQCQGGSPRFDIVTTTNTFFLGCNDVTPVVNSDGTATYSFTPADAFPSPVTGTITSADVLIDVHGVADVKNVTVNGIAQNLKQAHKQKHHHRDKGKDKGKDKDKGNENGHHGHGGDRDRDDD